MPTYISVEGLEKLQAEFIKRKTETRREMAKRIEAAKELGDLSENFEYHEARDKKAVNETRIMELDGMIKDAVIVKAQSGQNIISLGSQFTAASANGERIYQMVGSSESDPLSGKISNESPLGQAFLG